MSARESSPLAGQAIKPSVIAFCIEELTVGGAERMVVAMANEFVQLGWDVHLVCLKDAGIIAVDLDSAVSVHVLNKQPGLDLYLPFRLNRCLQRINPIAVNSHLWVGNTWTRIALFGGRIPVVVTEHSRDDWKPSYYRWIDRLLARRTALLVSVSADTADFYRDTIGLPASLIRVINNGVDTERYASGQGTSLRAQWLGDVVRMHKLPADKQIIIVTVGRLVAAKNHKRLIDVLHMLTTDPALVEYDLRLIVVGDGEDRIGIEQYVHEKGLQRTVIFTGARHDIPDVLAAFDMFVLSSDREGHPLTALEAQAAGTPVVLTDAGGSREAIAREADRCGGVLVERSAQALADAIRQMILQPTLRAERALFARQYALANFDKRQMVQRYAEVFSTLAK